MRTRRICLVRRLPVVLAVDRKSLVVVVVALQCWISGMLICKR